MAAHISSWMVCIIFNFIPQKLWSISKNYYYDNRSFATFIILWCSQERKWIFVSEKMWEIEDGKELVGDFWKLFKPFNSIFSLNWIKKARQVTSASLHLSLIYRNIPHSFIHLRFFQRHWVIRKFIMFSSSSTSTLLLNAVMVKMRKEQ